MSFLTNFGIGGRLAIGFAIALVFSIASTVVGLRQLDAVVTATREMMEKPVAKERLASDWYRNVFAAIRRTTAIVKSTDDSLGTFFKDDSAATAKASTDLQKAFEARLVTDEEKEIYRKIGESRAAYVKARDTAINAKTAGQSAEATRIFEQEYLPQSKQYEGLLLNMVSIQRKAIDEQASAIEKAYRDGFTMMLLLGVLLVAFTAVCAFFIARSITKPIALAAVVARRVAAGDLTGHIEVTGNDETGRLLQALKEMNEKLLNIVGTVRSGTESIGTGTQQIASGNADLSQRTEEQASSLEETASSMEELTSTVKQNAENAKQANQLAIGASAVAVKGGAVVGQVVATMSSINESSKKIADIISVIDGIAFQTNILALNAAVEAARAGEQGRGFAVVATEVRNLAQRSAAAAKEIKGLIGDSVDKVGAGTKLVDEAGKTMQEIVTAVKRVTDIMAEITAASHEQSQGIEQVNQAITQMDEVTQQNAALVEQAAAAAESLEEQAQQLMAAVSAFNIGGGGGSQARPVARRAAAEPRAARPAPVARIASRPAAAPRVPAKPAGGGSDDEWEEF